MVENQADRDTLKSRSMRGAAISLTAQMGKLGCQLVYQVSIARLLSPAEFGIVAMAAPLFAFLQFFSDLGLSQATIQRSHMDSSALSFLFWVNVLASVVLGMVTLAVAPLIGMFYGDPRVSLITAASAAILLFGGIASQHVAIINRNLAFGRLALADVGSFVIGAVAGLLGAAYGLGYWALWLAQAVNSCALMVLACVLSGWRPGKPQLSAQWRSLLGFGANVTGFNIANFFARNADNVLIGKFNGEVALGFYDRAYKLLLMPLTQVSVPMTKVALPLLARTLDSPSHYRTAFSRTLDAVILMTYPCVIFAISTHEPLIRAVLGEKWMGAAPIFGILSVGALFAPLGNSTGWLFTSQNRTREMRNWGIVSSLIFVTAFICGLPWGPVGVASAYIGTGIVLQGPLVLWAATREGPVELADIAKLLLPHAFAAAACFLVEFMLSRTFGATIVELVALFLVAYLVYFSALLLIPAGRARLSEFWRAGRPVLVRVGLLSA